MTGNVVVLTGGVGGAKLVLGLTQVVAPESITAIVNTADDFRHFRRPISPDIDTLLVDARDDVAGLTLPHAATDTLMQTLEDRARVAGEALALADRIARGR